MRLDLGTTFQGFLIAFHARCSDSKIGSSSWGPFPAEYHPFAHERLPTHPRQGYHTTYVFCLGAFLALRQQRTLSSRGDMRSPPPQKHLAMEVYPANHVPLASPELPTVPAARVSLCMF